MTDGYKIKRVYIRQNGVQKQIYPATWNPGANTLVYYPFTEDFNDYSGNSHNLTNYGNVSITTVNGVKCAQFANTSPYGLYSNDNVIPSGNYTWLGWLNDNGGTFGGNTRIFGGNNDWFILLTIESSWKKYGPQYPGSNGIPWDSGWHLYCFVGSTATGAFSGYKDGVFVASGTGATGSRSGIRIGGKEGSPTASLDAFIGNMGAIIFEDRQWTQQEISDYYNQTKSNYGL